MLTEGYDKKLLGATELRRRVESIRAYIRELEETMSVHDAIIECAAVGAAGISEIFDAIAYSREAMARLCRINEVMESLGGEVSELKWELSRRNLGCRFV